VTHFPVAVICEALRVARRTAYYVARARADGRYHADVRMRRLFSQDKRSLSASLVSN